MLTNTAPHASGLASKLVDQRAQYVNNQRAPHVNSKDFRELDMLTNATPHASGPVFKLVTIHQRAQYVNIKDLRGLNMSRQGFLVA